MDLPHVFVASQGAGFQTMWFSTHTFRKVDQVKEVKDGLFSISAEVIDRLETYIVKESIAKVNFA